MSKLSPKDLLLSPHLEFQQVVEILQPYGFRDIKKADGNLQLMADEPRPRKILSEIIHELLDCLSRCPDPDQAINYFERFSAATYNKTQFFSYLKDSPYTLWLLAKLFGSSPFMSEILVRTPTYLYWITNPQVLEGEKSRTAFHREAEAMLNTLTSKERKLEVLCLFKRREVLRIGSRDLLKKSSLQETTRDLSVLAEVIAQKVYEICDRDLRRRYGTPLRRTASGAKKKAAFTVLAMGKLGGEELNFSSDIDLIYLYDSDVGYTEAGKNQTRISNSEYFRRLAQEITSALTGQTEEGYLYRVDLRLRPEGKAGPIAYSLAAYKQYYAKRGETWERLALLKAWPIAGDRALGLKFLKTVGPFIYEQPPSLEHFREVAAVKARIDLKLKAKGEEHRHVKLGIGGIRELEFTVQSLQAFTSRQNPQIRDRNTLKAIEKLRDKEILDEEAARRLTEAYIFLRNLEHRLQMVHEFQTHLLPQDPHEQALCALRMDYQDNKDQTAADQFLEDFRRHKAQVHRVFQDLFSDPAESRLLKQAAPKHVHSGSKRAAKKP